MKGLFLVIEGADGSGKTTQIKLLKDYLSKKGYDSIITREPGGTRISEKIRSVILDKENMEMSDMTELLLYAAARAQHIDELILPALKEGKIVICDRFVDSSAVYQGIARGLGVDLVYEVNQYAMRGVVPVFTFLLDISAEEGIKRKKNQAELDRMELQKLEFHQKVVDGYKSLVKESRNRMICIDANLPIEEIHHKIVLVLEDKFFNKSE